MEVVCDGLIGDEFVLGVNPDLFSAEEVEDILGLKPALIELFELFAGDVSVSAHLQYPW
jgi:hypothetical protein